MYGETPQLQPIVPNYHLSVLSEDQLGQLEAATLEILEEVGIHCPSEKALRTVTWRPLGEWRQTCARTSLLQWSFTPEACRAQRSL